MFHLQNNGFHEPGCFVVELVLCVTAEAERKSGLNAI